MAMLGTVGLRSATQERCVGGKLYGPPQSRSKAMGTALVAISISRRGNVRSLAAGTAVLLSPPSSTCTMASKRRLSCCRPRSCKAHGNGCHLAEILSSRHCR